MTRTRTKQPRHGASVILPRNEAKKLLGHLARSHHFAQVLAWRLTDANAKDAAAYRTAARATHQRDGEVEIDDSAPVSIGDGGAYVNAWVWVGHDEVQS